MNAALQRKVSSRLNGGLMWERAILAAVDCPFLPWRYIQKPLGSIQNCGVPGGASRSEFIRESVLLSMTRDGDFVER